ncbi:MAG TPA: PHB depolymerase family esterase, partial [Variovorax sp.]|nr:PHB depolymerase family esterase [Variovorax sp.]
MEKVQWAIIGFASAVLLGCGGSGNDGTTVAVDPVPPASPAGDGQAAAPPPVTCGASSASLVKSTITVNGTAREYFESAPTAILPLREKDARGIAVVVNFHDANQNGQSGAASTCWNEVGETNGAVTVFPSALGGNWNTKGTAGAADEVAFLKAILPVIKTKYALASNAIVYYTGVGQGGRMAQSMAMQAPQFLAAVASIDGTAEPEVFGFASDRLSRTTMSSWIIRTKTQTDTSEATQIAYWNK